MEIYNGTITCQQCPAKHAKQCTVQATVHPSLIIVNTISQHSSAYSF